MTKYIVLFFLLITWPGFAAHGANKSKINNLYFEIETVSLSKALLQFAQQADISISLPPISFRHTITRPLKGDYTVTKGLQTLLNNTGYSFKVISRKAVRVYKPVLRKKAPKKPSLLETPHDAEPVIEDIIVTATRRKAYGQWLPYSASIINLDETATALRSNTASISSNVASLFITQQSEGRSKLIIRGVSEGAFTGRLQSLVATYQDNSRLNYSSPEPNLDLIDVSHVEVLRGPQGTLYGSGALTGIYRVVTKQPSLDQVTLALSSSVAATENGQPSYSLATVLNIPLVSDKLALRFMASYKKTGGYIDDIRLNIADVNENKYIRGNLNITYQPLDELSVSIDTTYRQINSADTNYSIDALNYLERDNFVQEPQWDELLKVALTVTASLAEFEIVSTTTWLRRDILLTQDASTALPRLFDITVRPGVFSTSRRINNLINETHISSPSGGRFEWIAGSFISYREDTFETRLAVPGLGNQNSELPADDISVEALDDDLTEFAFFGELTGYLSQNFSVTVGLRWFDYKTDAVARQQNASSATGLILSGANKETGFIPKLLLSWHPNADHSLYTQISQGYRLGGVNPDGFRFLESVLADSISASPLTSLGNFDSDTLTSFELGWKAAFVDSQLTLNTAVFYAKWANIQALQAGAAGLVEIANIGDGRIFGVELEAAFQPRPTTKFAFNLTWNKSKVTHVSTGSFATLNDELPGAPEFSSTLSAQHSFSFAKKKYSLHSQYSFVGATKLLFQRQGNAVTDSYHLLNLELGTKLGLGNLSIYVENLLRSRANVFAASNPFRNTQSAGSTPLTVTPIRPRTYGLTWSWQY